MTEGVALCKCGCGRPAPIASTTKKALGWVKGQPLDYLRGHNKRRTPHGTLCSVPGCENPYNVNGLCHGHYEWQRRHKKTPTHLILETDEERFLAKVKKLDSGHWIWTGARSSQNLYGAATYAGRVQPAHRVAWQLYRGPIADGLELDHLCRKTLCCNPDHLEPVTPRVNSLRSDSPAAANAAKTHCIRGHEFTPENTYVQPSNGGRICRACVNRPEAKAERAARRKARRAASSPSPAP